MVDVGDAPWLDPVATDADELHAANDAIIAKANNAERIMPIRRTGLAFGSLPLGTDIFPDLHPLRHEADELEGRP